MLIYINYPFVDVIVCLIYWNKFSSGYDSTDDCNSKSKEMSDFKILDEISKLVE